MYFLLAVFTHIALTVIVSPFLFIIKALSIRFKQYKQTIQDRIRGNIAVRLATSVRVSYKRIRNALKATVTLTFLAALRF